MDFLIFVTMRDHKEAYSNRPFLDLLFERTCILFIILLFFWGCQQNGSQEIIDNRNPTSPLFTRLSPQQSGITFQNTLTDGLNTNTLVYEYFYNGGGVVTADMNGDDLIDIYFSANMSENRLYINQGNMQFKEVTNISGAMGRSGPWKTGVAMIDINGDNRQDIYLCYSGMMPEQKRVNQLYINQGNNPDGIPLFKESAAEFDLATPAYSNQSYYFDYDQDGDLDMLLLNHNPKNLPIFNEQQNRTLMAQDDPLMGVRLFNQSQGRFEDVTIQAGINGSP